MGYSEKFNIFINTSLSPNFGVMSVFTGVVQMSSYHILIRPNLKSDTLGQQNGAKILPTRNNPDVHLTGFSHFCPHLPDLHMQYNRFADRHDLLFCCGFKV